MIEDKITKKELLLDYTMQAVAESGMMSFSMQTVTKMAGTAEGLIYKHYHTKENLLLQCYLYIYEEIRNCIEQGSSIVPEIITKEDAFGYLRNLWKKYFDYLICNSYKTLYMHEYRISPYMKNATEKGKINPKGFFKKTVSDFYCLDKRFNILNKVDLKTLFVYTTDVTILFAIRLINEGTNCDESLYDSVWKLIWGGESWLINH